MISKDTLQAAVTTGVISADQAHRIHALENARAVSGAEPEDDEKLRLISGFSDIFVSLGIVLFLSAAGYFLFRAGGAILLWPGLAAAAWALAEFFTRVRRMAFPSILLLLIFAGASFIASYQIIALSLGAPDSALSPWTMLIFSSKERAMSVAGAGLVTAGLATLHYMRFQVPITIAAGVAALASTALALLYTAAPDFTSAMINPICLMLGLAVFALAMHYDLSDPRRVTRRTDIAFWLHLLAAPMIVHPLVSGMFDRSSSMSAEQAIAILAIFLALGFVAVIIDRRALLVSGLSYAGFAFASLLRQTGLSDALAPATLLTLGAFVLLLSAGWHPLRARILSLVPADLAERLPHQPGPRA